MDTIQKLALNHFFVATFNKILAWEEQALSRTGCQNLSVKEIHILEAVSALQKTNANTMSKIAGRLSISVGALTTAINVLVNKGYIERQRKNTDRRIVVITLTEKGISAEQKHQLFHEEMIQNVATTLQEEELETLIRSLKALSDFFENKIQKEKHKI